MISNSLPKYLEKNTLLARGKTGGAYTTPQYIFGDTDKNWVSMVGASDFSEAPTITVSKLSDIDSTHTNMQISDTNTGYSATIACEKQSGGSILNGTVACKYKTLTTTKYFFVYQDIPYTSGSLTPGTIYPRIPRGVIHEVSDTGVVTNRNFRIFPANDFFMTLNDTSSAIVRVTSNKNIGKFYCDIFAISNTSGQTYNRLVAECETSSTVLLSKSQSTIIGTPYDISFNYPYIFASDLGLYLVGFRELTAGVVTGGYIATISGGNVVEQISSQAPSVQYSGSLNTSTITEYNNGYFVRYSANIIRGYAKDYFQSVSNFTGKPSEFEA